MTELLDTDAMVIYIQALQDAIRYHDLVAPTSGVNPADVDETKYLYEVELGRLCALYAAEEKQGKASIPLSRLLERSS